MLFGFKEPEPDYEAIWNEYSAIEQRMQQDYEDELAAARADLGGRGIQEGSEAWEAAMQTIEDKRQTRMGELQATEAGQILQGGYQSMVEFARLPMRLAEYGDDSQQTSIRKPVVDLIYGKGAGQEMQSMLESGQGFQQSGNAFNRQGWTRNPITMGQFYENQFGLPEMAEPMDQGGSVESAAAQAAQTRARRAAAGGFSPWW